MMMVNISGFEDSLVTSIPFQFVIKASDMGFGQIDYAFIGDIAVKGMVISTGQAYRVQGVIRCLKSFTCDRCLEHAVEEQSHKFSEDFKPAEDCEENEAVESFSGDVIDLAGLVHDTILAAQSVSNICSPECRGLCPVCGANLNEGECGCNRDIIDPRLAMLQHLLEKN